MTDFFSARFARALAFAHELHRKQKRKTSGAPYVAHLLGVAALVMEDGGSEDEAIAALLHDSLEDQGRHYPGGVEALAAEIEREFGPDVVRLVDTLTERIGPDERAISDKRARWRAHKLAYIRQIGSAEARVRRISCADSIYNVRSLTRDYLRMGDEMWTRFLTRSRDDQLWAYDGVARALEAAGGGPLAGELNRAVDELFRATGTERPASTSPR
ncbi:MAG: HD domain-containing protein [Acidobacteriota bacterium]